MSQALKQVFINAQVKALNGEEWAYNEGCLSIPKIREDVMRSESVTISFVDEKFVQHEKLSTVLPPVSFCMNTII